MQCFISECLGLTSPNYGHFPVLINSDGAKLSKQTFASPVDWKFPGTTYSQLAKLLLLRTHHQTETRIYLAEFFQSVTTPETIKATTGVANTLSV